MEESLSLTIQRHVTPLLLTAALSGVGVFLPAATHAQDLAEATPDIGLATTDVEMANAWPPEGAAPTPASTGLRALAWDFLDGVKHLPSRQNMWWAIGGGAGALAVHPADKRVTASFANASWTGSFFALGDFTGAFR